MRLLLPLVAILSASALAQPADYFPLGASDSWTYGFVVDPPFAPPDTFLSAPVQVEGTTTVRDTVYTMVSLPSLWSDTLRTDAEGRVFARIAGRDQLYLDPTLDDGQSYQVNEYVVTVTRDLTVETPSGRFGGVVDLAFDIPNTLDAGFNLKLAPGVGLVQTSGPFTDYRDLFEARVGGTVILDRTDGPEEAPVRAFPSPFARTLTIELASPGRQRVEILDALGREVAVVFDGGCAATCRATWDAGGAAPGMYLVRATTPTGVSSQSVVLGR